MVSDPSINKITLINKLLLVPAIFCLLFSCVKKNADTGDYSEPYKAFAAELDPHAAAPLLHELVAAGKRLDNKHHS